MRRPPFLAVFHCSGDVFIVRQDRSRVERPGLSTVLAMQPETRYADSGGVNIAYQTLGKGPQDLVFVHGWASNIEVYQEEPAFVRFVSRLTSFAGVILFDKRGTGLSDRVGDMPSLEVRMDDVRAVMDAVGSERAALFGVSEGGTMCALFSATYPQRTTALIMHGSFPRRTKAADYPFGLTDEQMRLWIARLRREWGGPVGLAERAPSMVGDERFSQWWGRMLRMAVSPAGIAALTEMNAEIDIRHILPAIRVPTLLLHSPRDLAIEFETSRYMAERIPGARLLELPGPDHLPWLSDADVVLGEIEEFLTGVRHTVEPDRVLATVLFTDIVGATEKASALVQHAAQLHGVPPDATARGDVRGRAGVEARNGRADAAEPYRRSECRHLEDGAPRDLERRQPVPGDGAEMGTILGHQHGTGAGRAQRRQRGLAGLFNTYFWLDPSKRVTGTIMTQLLPFADPEVLKLFGKFESGLYSAVS